MRDFWRRKKGLVATRAKVKGSWMCSTLKNWEMYEGKQEKNKTVEISYASKKSNGF